MQQLILNIEENRYALLLQFLNTLDYVKVVQTSSSNPSVLTSQNPSTSDSQLVQLRSVLEQQSKPLFQGITDPLNWQNQQRDEWS
ncbi:MAG: hypothetical protein NW218_00095 [Saprospiraceae bacterium]|nr:hypothetical protein [Saprospiraceae bacterium]